MSQLQDAETGQRGYLLTGEPKYLEPYVRARTRLDADTTALRRAIGDDAPQHLRLDSLDALIRRKLQELAETIELRRTQGMAPSLALVQTDRGKAVMDSIRLLLGAMTTEERSRLDQRNASEFARGRMVTLILVLGSLVAATLSLLLGMMLYRAASFESRAVIALERQRDALVTQSTELARQTRQLQEQAAELESRNADLQDQAAELEAQAEELETSSQELAEQTRAAESARDTAEAANRAKSDFLAMMSHELRTPLNAIAGYAQLMQLGVPEAVPPAHQEYLERIQTSQHHLLGVINSVLNFARLEAGAVVYHLRNVPVADLLTAVEPLIAPQARAKSHTYTCVPCDRSLIVWADSDKVTQILLNLMSNAVKFTPPGGGITLSAELEPMDGRPEAARRVALCVRDTGMGIPKDKQRTIFDPFVQVDQSRTRTTDGAGLGLAISRELARGMAGDLECESALGVGSTFTLFLQRVPSGD
jgi:signal transduction histidine kinase